MQYLLGPSGPALASKMNAAVTSITRPITRPHSGVLDIVVVAHSLHSSRGAHSMEVSLESTDWEVLVGYDSLRGYQGPSDAAEVEVLINGHRCPGLTMVVGQGGRCVFKSGGSSIPSSQSLRDTPLQHGRNDVVFELLSSKSLYTMHANLFVWDSNDKVVVVSVDGVLVQRDTLSKGTGALTLGRHSGQSFGWEHARPWLCNILSYLTCSGYRLVFVSNSPITLSAKIKKRVSLLQAQESGSSIEGALLTCPDRTVSAVVKGLYNTGGLKIRILDSLIRAFGANHKAKEGSQEINTELADVSGSVFAGAFVDGKGDAGAMLALGAPQRAVFIVESQGTIVPFGDVDGMRYSSFKEMLPSLPAAFPPINGHCVTPAAFVDRDAYKDCSGDVPREASLEMPSGDESLYAPLDSPVGVSFQGRESWRDAPQEAAVSPYLDDDAALDTYEDHQPGVQGTEESSSALGTDKSACSTDEHTSTHDIDQPIKPYDTDEPSSAYGTDGSSSTHDMDESSAGDALTSGKSTAPEADSPKKRASLKDMLTHSARADEHEEQQRRQQESRKQCYNAVGLSPVQENPSPVNVPSPIHNSSNSLPSVFPPPEGGQQVPSLRDIILQNSKKGSSTSSAGPLVINQQGEVLTLQESLAHGTAPVLYTPLPHTNTGILSTSAGRSGQGVSASITTKADEQKGVEAGDMLQEDVEEEEEQERSSRLHFPEPREDLWNDNSPRVMTVMTQHSGGVQHEESGRVTVPEGDDWM